jgi:DNA-binding winged helix-turn-helix (wHTH) protein
MTPSSGKQYEFGDWRLNPAERLLVRQGEQIALTPKVFDTLALLVENAGSLVSKEDFMERLWPEAFVEDAVLTQNISQLRKVLGDPSAIETVPKKGYRFLKPVKAITDGSAETHGKEFHPEEATSSQTRKRLVTACILLVAVGLMISLAYVRNHDTRASVSHEIRSLAVLPLENLSGDPFGRNAWTM